MKLYKEMNSVFFKLRDIEGEMVETAHIEFVKKQEQDRKDQEVHDKAVRAVTDEHGGTLDKYNDPKYLAGLGGYGGHSSGPPSAPSQPFQPPY